MSDCIYGVGNCEYIYGNITHPKCDTCIYFSNETKRTTWKGYRKVTGLDRTAEQIDWIMQEKDI